MTILEFILVFSILLAFLYLSTILTSDLLFLYNYAVLCHNLIDGTILSNIMSVDLNILGRLFQSTLFSQSPLNLIGSLLFINEFNILYSFIPFFKIIF
jgi:hypothetical protein